ncbi:serine acetyltransferase [Microbacterium sp. SORGH_AS428]|uniref:serine O-acetyltransferase n=1 Tax=Microbacterium sp. SORGH_AS_0428 TaxID=3041788 RepID=UPI00285723BC|nr:hypothetical protein [Microbacterium sp. SORGH_AS_0428]MDR6199294.1 serine acetyltransferase [Microbacterium sp. SORGH_AS_0428]
MFDSLRADLAANRGRPHIQTFFALRHTAVKLRHGHPLIRRTFGAVATIAYRSYSLFVLSIDIPVSTELGHGIAIHHGFGLVINDRARIGSGVTLRHSTTIGARDDGSAAPVVGDAVDIGAGVTLLGPITIGSGSRIGSGSVVISDVPPFCTAVGNPARLLEARRTPQADDD